MDRKKNSGLKESDERMITLLSHTYFILVVSPLTLIQVVSLTFRTGNTQIEVDVDRQTHHDRKHHGASVAT